MSLNNYDFSQAIGYHYGQFPPKEIDYEKLSPIISRTSAAIARCDAVMRGLHNSELLLAPLRRREAVISSRIEGTIATLDEVLMYEADDSSAGSRREVVEVFSYERALSHAQKLIHEGLPISGRLIKQAHSKMLFFGRGADKQPGEFKSDQNYVVDPNKKRILFIPSDMARFEGLFSKFEEYANRDDLEPLIQIAISHLEFEALHPFKDGNGRVGRMLITLMLWTKNLISAPHFYISGQLEQQKQEYIDRMREVSEKNKWTEWCVFFLQALEAQANENLSTAMKIEELYEEMKVVFQQTLSSQWAINALDYVFNKPVFRNNAFTSESGIPKPTAHRMTHLLTDAELLTEIVPASGRRAAIYAFEPLLKIVRP